MISDAFVTHLSKLSTCFAFSFLPLFQAWVFTPGSSDRELQNFCVSNNVDGAIRLTSQCSAPAAFCIRFAALRSQVSTTRHWRQLPRFLYQPVLDKLIGSRNSRRPYTASGRYWPKFTNGVAARCVRSDKYCFEHRDYIFLHARHITALLSSSPINRWALHCGRTAASPRNVNRYA